MRDAGVLRKNRFVGGGVETAFTKSMNNFRMGRGVSVEGGRRKGKNSVNFIDRDLLILHF